MTGAGRARIVGNIAGHLGQASREVQLCQLAHFRAADEEHGARVARALGLDV